MINAQFVSLIKRGAVRGAVSLIDRKEFASTDPAEFEKCWEQCCLHAQAVLLEQDTIDGEYRPQNRSLESRRNLWKASNE